MGNQRLVFLDKEENMSDDIKSQNRRYFSSLLQTIQRRGVKLRTPRKAYFEHRQIIDSWPMKIDTAAKILRSKKEISVDLTLKSDEADNHFTQLRNDEGYFNDIIGGALRWKKTSGKERQIIAVLHADPTEEKDWPRQHAWIAAKLAAYRIAFEPVIERLTSARSH
jgi:hypothetical protein